MEIKNKSGHRYLIKTGRHLRCSANARKKFLDILERELYNFELENFGASYQDYIEEFGEPKVTAQKYMDELSDAEVLGYWNPIIVAAALTAVAILGFMFFYFVTHIENSSEPIYYRGELVSDSGTVACFISQ